MIDIMPGCRERANFITFLHFRLRIDNLIYDENESKVLAVLDWELSTLGDPVTDLALNCLPYYLSPKFPILKGRLCRS